MESRSGSHSKSLLPSSHGVYRSVGLREDNSTAEGGARLGHLMYSYAANRDASGATWRDKDDKDEKLDRP